MITALVTAENDVQIFWNGNMIVNDRAMNTKASVVISGNTVQVMGGYCGQSNMAAYYKIENGHLIEEGQVSW